MNHLITADRLYDYIQCPHKVWRDVYGPQEEKIEETNPFVRLLWNKGVRHEKKVVAGIGKYTDISRGGLKERKARTIRAIMRGDELIFHGLLQHENLGGEPDLLEKLPDGDYLPIDIKAGMGLENVHENDTGRCKKSYAVQLCLYAEILRKLGFFSGDQGLIIDINEDPVEYFLDKPMGVKTPQTWQGYYQEIKGEVDDLVHNRKTNLPARCGICKLCPWYGSCKKWWKKTDDLTNIFYLGRNTRDIISRDLHIETVKKLSGLDVKAALVLKRDNERFLSGVGEKTMEKLVARANVIVNRKKPVIYEKIDLPATALDLFFDIEADPTQDLVYLHGVYERRADGRKKFLGFVAENNTAKAEKAAWRDFWRYIHSLPQDDFAVYYYSPYEKVSYRKMQRKYPEVISASELRRFFAHPHVIDLYDSILKKTDWPLSNFSIREIAVYLGFNWRDKTPSGALSIQWYNKYLETRDPEILKRILEYNEDDCKATMVIKDFLCRQKPDQ